MLLPATRLVPPVCDALCKRLAAHATEITGRGCVFAASNRFDVACQCVSFLLFAAETPAVATEARLAHLAIVSAMLRGVYGQPYSGAA